MVSNHRPPFRLYGSANRLARPCALRRLPTGRLAAIAKNSELMYKCATLQWGGDWGCQRAARRQLYSPVRSVLRRHPVQYWFGGSAQCTTRAGPNVCVGRAAFGNDSCDQKCAPHPPASAKRHALDCGPRLGRHAPQPFRGDRAPYHQYGRDHQQRVHYQRKHHAPRNRCRK